MSDQSVNSSSFIGFRDSGRKVSAVPFVRFFERLGKRLCWTGAGAAWHCPTKVALPSIFATFGRIAGARVVRRNHRSI